MVADDVWMKVFEAASSLQILVVRTRLQPEPERRVSGSQLLRGNITTVSQVRMQVCVLT